MLPIFFLTTPTIVTEPLIKQLNQETIVGSAHASALPEGLVTMLLSLVLVLLLASLLLKWVQPWVSGFYKSSKDPKNRIDLLASQSIGGGKFLHVVGVAKQRWLISSGPQGQVQLISAMVDDPS